MQFMTQTKVKRVLVRVHQQHACAQIIKVLEKEKKVFSIYCLHTNQK
jgi:hypothetical protein